MFATMKIVGVTPDAIGRLHEVLSQPICQTKERLHLRQGISGLNKGECRGQFPYVTIEESKLDPEHKTYTVLIKVNLRFATHDDKETDNEYHFYQPMKVLRTVLQSIDPGLLPDEESKIPMPGTARRFRLEEMKAQEKALEDEVLEKVNSLIGKKPKMEICDPKGEVILAAGEVFRERGDHVWHEFTWDLERLSLPDSTDSFIITLREAQELRKRAMNLETERMKM